MTYIPRGSICAIVTPFRDNAELDFDAFSALLNWHLECGTDAVVVSGSTGESGALDENEYQDLLELAVERLHARVRVIAGVGAPATHKAIKQAKLAHRIGVDAVLAVTPYYARPTQAGLKAHFRAVAEASELPVILYNVPTRTGVDLLSETVAELSTEARIVSIKEARAEAERMTALLTLRSPTFSILSGDDPTAMRAMASGADGVISVAANVCPALFKHLCDLALSGQLDAAQQLDASMQPIYRVLGVEPNPIPAKWLLSEMGRIGPALRLPLLPLTATHHGSARDVLALIESLESAMEQSMATQTH